MPVTVVMLPGNELAVLDGANQRVTVFDASGKPTRNFVLPRDDGEEAKIDPGLFGGLSFLAKTFSLAADTLGNFYCLSKNGVIKIDLNGKIIRTLGDFSKIEMPISLKVDADGKVYVLDAKRCVVVLDQEGKETAIIGKIGKGKEEVQMPIDVLLGKDGKVFIVSTVLGEDDEGEGERYAVKVFDKDGKYLTAFAKASKEMIGAKDHEIFVGFGAVSSGDDVYVFDIEISFIAAQFVLKHFMANGDFIEKIKCPTVGGPLTSAVTSAAIDTDGKIYCAYPLSSLVLADIQNAKTQIGKPSENTITFPVASIPAPNGRTAVLEMFPCRLHVFSAEGQKVVPVKPLTEDFPGLDLTIGFDLAYSGSEYLVLSGSRVIRVSADNFNVVGSYELTTDIRSFDIGIALATFGKKVFVLDASSKVTVFTEGLPSSFKVPRSPSDIAVDKDGDVYLLYSKESSISVFSQSGDFKREMKCENVGQPTSLCIKKTGEIVVTDPVNGKIVELTSTGQELATYGVKGGPKNFATEDDYKEAAGYFKYPYKVRCDDEGILSVIDLGNMRTQTIAHAEEEPPPPPPEPAKLALDKNSLDFEEVYYENTKSLSVTLTNLGEQELVGTVQSLSPAFKVTPSVVNGSTKSITVTVAPAKAHAWTLIKSGIRINTNGGSVELPVSAIVLGKTIRLSIGSTDIRVTKDGPAVVVNAGRGPIILSGRTYVPLRALGEVLGASVDWQSLEKKVTYKLESTTVELWIGKSEAKVNGAIVALSNPPIIVGGSTYVPLRFVSEQLGAGIEWDAASKTATVFYPSKP